MALDRFPGLSGTPLILRSYFFGFFLTPSPRPLPTKKLPAAEGRQGQAGPGRTAPAGGGRSNGLEPCRGGRDDLERSKGVVGLL